MNSLEQPAVSQMTTIRGLFATRQIIVPQHRYQRLRNWPLNALIITFATFTFLQWLTLAPNGKEHEAWNISLIRSIASAIVQARSFFEFAVLSLQWPSDTPTSPAEVEENEYSKTAIDIRAFDLAGLLAALVLAYCLKSAYHQSP
jgi:hypothetical protein